MDNPTPPPASPSYVWSELDPQTELLYVRDHVMANRYLEGLKDDVLGFDMEWRPNFAKNRRQNPVALVQLASTSKILLLQISFMREFPTRLKEILENPKIVKTGAGIEGDSMKIWNDRRVSMRNIVDLSLLARSVDNPRWKGKYSAPIGLARLVATYENLTLIKGKITRSNWENYLSQQQKLYAANDAHAGLRLYQRLIVMGAMMPKSPECICYTFNLVRGRLCDSAGRLWIAQNPDYDPGPPPPPKQPKKPKDASTDSVDPTTPQEVLTAMKPGIGHYSDGFGSIPSASRRRV